MSKNYPVIPLGYGVVEIIEGWHEGKPALFFTTIPGGERREEIVVPTSRKPGESIPDEDILTVITIEKEVSLNVLLEFAGRLRSAIRGERGIPDAPEEHENEEN